MKTLLLTGGSGLLSLNWAITARDQYEVILGIHNREVELAGTTSLRCQIGSLENMNTFLDENHVDIVIHTAGLTNVDECEKNPELAKKTNVDLAENIAKACSEQDIRHVHISTDHLFSGKQSFVTEEQPADPVNIYGKTKALAEDRVMATNPDALVVRTNFYGWGTSYRHSFSDYIITSLTMGKKVTLYEDVFYTPIFTQVLVQAVHGLINNEAAGIYHVTGDERISKYNFGHKVAEHFQLDSSLIQPGLLADQDDMTQRPYDMSLSNTKATELLGKNLGGVDEHLELMKLQQTQGMVQEIQSL